MAKRQKPGAARLDVMTGEPEDRHQQKAREMHDAIYALQDKIRKPYNSGGDKLLPKDLRSSDTPEARAARAHIDMLHTAMKGCKED